MAVRSPENAERICSRIAEGYTVRQIARELDCTHGAIFHWVAEDSDFAHQYARAKLAQADRFADELIEISDHGGNDWLRRENDAGEPIEVPDHEHIQRSRLRVDTRKWLMSKFAPKKYGDKLELEHSGEMGFVERLAAARGRGFGGRGDGES